MALPARELPGQWIDKVHERRLPNRPGNLVACKLTAIIPPPSVEGLGGSSPHGISRHRHRLIAGSHHGTERGQLREFHAEIDDDNDDPVAVIFCGSAARGSPLAVPWNSR
jgi:hypothetical protein